jgi:hypothetical protein
MDAPFCFSGRGAVLFLQRRLHSGACRLVRNSDAISGRGLSRLPRAGVAHDPKCFDGEDEGEEDVYNGHRARLQLRARTVDWAPAGFSCRDCEGILRKTGVISAKSRAGNVQGYAEKRRKHVRFRGQYGIRKPSNRLNLSASNEKARLPPREPGTARENDACS